MVGQKTYRTRSYDAYSEADIGTHDHLLEALHREHPERAASFSKTTYKIQCNVSGAQNPAKTTIIVSHVSAYDKTPATRPEGSAAERGITITAPDDVAQHTATPRSRHTSITTLVCAEYQLTFEEIVARERKYTIPRALVVYLCRCEAKMSYAVIGRLLGRDRSTVVYAFNTIASQLDDAKSGYDSELVTRIQRIRAQLREVTASVTTQNNNDE